MQRYEYKVIPSPKRADKARGVKTTEDRFAHALTQLMNSLGAEGWDYLRADTLPCTERVGLTGSKTTYQSLLVFRRPVAEESTQVPAFASLRPVTEPEGPVLRLGAAASPHGAAPALGPASHEVAAE